MEMVAGVILASRQTVVQVGLSLQPQFVRQHSPTCSLALLAISRLFRLISSNRLISASANTLEVVGVIMCLVQPNREGTLSSKRKRACMYLLLAPLSFLHFSASHADLDTYHFLVLLVKADMDFKQFALQVNGLIVKSEQLEKQLDDVDAELKKGKEDLTRHREDYVKLMKKHEDDYVKSLKKHEDRVDKLTLGRDDVKYRISTVKEEQHALMSGFNANDKASTRTDINSPGSTSPAPTKNPHPVPAPKASNLPHPSAEGRGSVRARTPSSAGLRYGPQRKQTELKKSSDVSDGVEACPITPGPPPKRRRVEPAKTPGKAFKKPPQPSVSDEMEESP